MCKKSNCNIGVDKSAKKIEFNTSDWYSSVKTHGGRSSMAELQVVVLAVAGSSPVDHPTSPRGAIVRIRKTRCLSQQKLMRDFSRVPESVRSR